MESPSLHERWLAWSLDRFSVLLGLVVLNYVVLMLLPDDHLAVAAGATAVCATTLYALDAAGAHRKVRIAVRGILVSLVVMAFLFFGGVPGMRPVISLIFAATLAVGMYVVVRRLFGHENFSVTTLTAAVSVYVLLGLVFAELFIAAAQIGPMQHFVDQIADPSRSDLIYLSYITLTTVGFGDLTPRSGVARTLIITEALIGQIFLVTAVARVVSLFGSNQTKASSGEDLGG